MANFGWRTTSGDFGVASNWLNISTGANPSPTVPGAADVVNFNGSGTTPTGFGTITGVGAVDQLNVATGALGAWILAGQFTAGQVFINSATTIASGGRLTLLGKNPGTFFPSGGQINVPLTIDGGVLDSTGAQFVIGASYGIVHDGTAAVSIVNGGRATALGATIGQGSAGALSVSGAGSAWSSTINAALDTATIHSGYLTLGQQGTVNNVTTSGSGTLSVSNSGAVTVGNGIILGLDAGSSGTATVSSGGVFTATGGNINVGSGAGSTGSLTINAGGTVRSTSAGQLGYVFNIGANGVSGATAGAVGTVTVQGAGALLDLGANAASVGFGGTGTLNILAGGVVRSTSSDIVNGPAGLAVARQGTGTVLVSGAGSTLALVGGMYAGRAAGTNGTVTVTAGGTLTQGVVAVNEGSDGNTFGGSGTVNGAFINGGRGTLNVTVGGTANFASVLSFGLNGSTGVGLVSDAGSSLTAQNTLTLGSGTTAAGGNGSLTIQNGGAVLMTAASDTSKNYLTLGAAASTTGLLTVTGTGSLLDVGANTAAIGNTGTGALVVSAGATARSSTADNRVRGALSVGNATGSVGSVTVTGAGSSYDAGGGAYFGRGGAGTLVVDQAGVFTGGKAAIGDGSGANAVSAITIGDGTPSLDVNGVANTPLYFGGSGTGRVLNGSMLHSRGDLLIGNRGGTGTLLLDGGSVAVGDRYVSVGTGTDRAGATGTVTVQGGSTLRGGGLHVLANSGVSIGVQVGTTGAVTVTGAGSLLDGNGDRVTVGSRGAGTLNVTAGGRVVSGASYADTEAAFAVGAFAGSSGTVTISGAGSQIVAAGQAVLGGTDGGTGLAAGGSGAVTVSGGGLFRALNLSLLGAATLTVDGGSSAVIGSSAGTVGRLTVDAGASIGGTGLVTATLRDSGSVVAQGGRLSFSTVEAGNTGVLGANNGTLELLTSGSQAFQFFGSAATIRLHQVSGASTVSGFVAGDVLDFGDSTAASVSGNVVTVSGGSGPATYTVAGLAAGMGLVVGADGLGGVQVTAGFVSVDPLFDTAYYLSHNADVAAAGIDPYQHYLSSGWREGRDPSAYFSTSYYLSHNADVAAAGINPLLHFEASGWREGRDPSAVFSDSKYLAAYPDIAAAGIDPLLHYVIAGRAEGRQAFAVTPPPPPPPPSDPLVNAAYYYTANPDVRAAGVDASAHYLANGWREGRNPNGFFDTNFYLAQNPDVRAAGINPLQHFEASGWLEGRQPSLLFDDAKYLAANPDVRAAGFDPLLHYLNNGQAEGRVAFLTGGTLAADPLVDTAYYDRQLGATLIPGGLAGAQQAAWSYDTSGWLKGLNPDAFFDTNYYLSHNPDVAAAHIDPLLHYESNGWREGRDPSALFSTNKYLAAYGDVRAAGIDPLLHYVLNGQAEGRTAFGA